MKRTIWIIQIVILLLCFGCKDDTPPNIVPEACTKFHEDLPPLTGTLSYSPIQDCQGDVINENFTNLQNWSKRITPARAIFENASFQDAAVRLNNGNLELVGGFYYYEQDPRCLQEGGGQVEYTLRQFSPDDEYTYSIIMKPTSQAGIVSAFFIHRIDENTNNPSVCKNNHEIDIEVIKYGQDADPTLRGKLYIYFTSWTRALNSWGMGNNPCQWNDQKWDDRQQETHGIQLDDRYTNEFHKYSFTWKRNRIDFFVDDNVVVTHTKVVPDKPGPLKINTWANHGWMQYSTSQLFEGVTQIRKVSVGTKFSQGLVAYYPFNRNANDESGNGKHGTRIGTPSLTTDRFGRDSSAYSLSGSSQYISLPSSISILNNLSVSFWMQTTAADTNKWPSGMFIVDRDICYLYRDWSVCMGLGGKIQFNTGTPSRDSVLTSSININDGTWKHIVVVRDVSNSSKKIYINGQLNVTGTFDNQSFTNNSYNIYLGASVCATSTHTYFRGKIDDIRFYNRVLSDTEIQQLYTEQ